LLTNALLVIAALLGALLLYAATRPDTFRVERHVVINRPAADIFPLLEDFHAWTRWSPWEGLDPTLRRTYRGPESGKGAVYEWEGNAKVGKGRMEIIRSESPTHLTIDLSFLRPFKAENAAAFDLEPQGTGTEVSWAMYGPLPFASKLMSVFVSMDKLIGRDFEKGLERLKVAAETRSVVA
jgi:uncharacterized protein YndB with AHSA1/START domain